MSGVSGSAVYPQPPTKTIVVYRNGDAFFPGRKFVVNQRHVSTFGSFLSSVTRGVEAPFGAVRNVYTPRQGHQVFDLDSLQNGERYVAAGGERFKKLDYYHIATKKPQKKKNEPIRPVVHSRIVVPARWRKFINESCTINVFTNGDVMVPPARVIIPKYTLKSWESVLAMVTEKVHLRTGAVHRLCALDGTPLQGSVQLENNQYYVAVGAEKFRPKSYYDWVPSKDIIRDINLLGHSNSSLPAIRKVRYSRNAFAHPEFVEDPARGQQARQQKDFYFYAKPERAKQQKQVSRIPLLLTTGEGSVFRAKHKRRETQGASEVQEDRQVKVDLPIDQVEAKVVDEEQYARRSSRPSNGAQSSYRAFPKDSPSTNKPLCASSRTESSGAGEGQESGRGTGLTSSRHGGLRSPLLAETQQGNERGGGLFKAVRDTVTAKFFKERSKK